LSLISPDRWTVAQAAELRYWQSLDLREILRICAEKPDFLALLDDQVQYELFTRKEVLEIGCGPLGLSLASFSRHKTGLKRLVKAEPLPPLPTQATRAAGEGWASPFIAWVEQLAAEGEYLQCPGEELVFDGEFDTVVTYNVLDHVRAPQAILRNAYKALRPGGNLLVGVDCLSMVGRWRFEWLTRRTHKGSILVEAHPHTFLPRDVASMIEAAGFQMLALHGLPSRLRGFAGHHTRPAFLARK
jgi:SAM-dependent methyltransferase